MTLRSLTTASAVLLVSAGAMAGSMPAFDKVDQNGDGKLTKQEVKESDAIGMELYREADFGKLTDNDNVTEFEYQTLKDEKRAEQENDS